MPHRTVRVLYIDDDPALARLVQKSLARRGNYKVEIAASGEEGLALLDEQPIDVVALDHYLPRGTGLDVLTELARRPGAPPVVYVTGSAEAAVAVHALKAGAYDYVTKTVGDEFLELLGNAIDQAIETARLRRDKASAEQEMREARERAELLLAEVNHRVANSLALVSALVRMQSSAVHDPQAKAALEETQARISAVAGIHRVLYTSSDVRSVSISDYLKGLVAELDTTLDSGGKPFVRLDVEPMQVPTDKAVPIAVIVTELVTNAFKYAYPNRERGEVRVRLHRHEGDRARLSVEDDGIGWGGEGKPQGTGLGSRIVKALSQSLGSKVEYDTSHGGTAIRLDFAV